MIDPKPFVGDPAYDPVQHVLNCDERLSADPLGLARRMVELLDLDAERVRLWLFARCAQESVHDLTTRDLATPPRTLTAPGSSHPTAPSRRPFRFGRSGAAPVVCGPTAWGRRMRRPPRRL